MTISAASTLSRVRTGSWCLLLVPSLADKIGADMPDARWPFSHLLVDEQYVQSSVATSVHRALLLNGGHPTPVYVKHFHFRSTFDLFKHFLRKSRAMRAVSGDALLRRSGFIAPQTLIAGWRQRWGNRTDYFTVTTAMEGYRNIYQTIGDVHGRGDAEKQAFIKALAATVAELHRTRISHGDMRAGNILCQQDTQTGCWRFAFIDNERTRRYPYLPVSLRVKNLVQLNLLSDPALETEDRHLFYETYSTRCFGRVNKNLRNKVIAKTLKRQAKKQAKPD